jgi:glycosyltransferase involved in cell wall biosynthesis
MKDNCPTVSACLSVYNSERHVGQAIQSILNQTFKDFELLIIDDGSTDGSRRILEDDASRDPRIKLTCRENRGYPASLNEMIDRASGQFIAIMDADDIARPQRFERQVEYLRARPDYVLLGSRVLLVDVDGDPLCDWCTIQEHEQLDSGFFQENPGTILCHPSVMMRRDTLLAIGKYRQFAMMEDFDLFLRMAEHGRIANYPDVLLEYRVHLGSKSNTPEHRERARRVAWEMVEDARQRRGLPSHPFCDHVPEKSQDDESEHEKWAWWALTSGHIRTARKHAMKLLLDRPMSPRAWKAILCSIRGH